MKFIVVTVLCLCLVSVLASLPDWDCPKIPRRSPAPTNVNDLNPADIKVVMAVGDSMTAGFAMVRF
jgi:phospholipase B1